MEAPGKSSGAETARRAVRALKLVASQSGPGLRLVDLAQQMGLERPTAHRLLKVLVDEGMLVQHPESRRYQLGALVFELGLAAAHQFNLSEICQPLLSELAERTGDTAFLFVRSGNDAVCIARVQGHYPIQTPSIPVGARQPLGVSAGGLALLSTLAPEEARAIIGANENRLSAYGELDRERVLECWESARQTGYAVIGNAAAPGITAVALPVRNEMGVAIAAMSVAAITSRMTAARAQEIAPMLREATAQLAALVR